MLDNPLFQQDSDNRLPTRCRQWNKIWQSIKKVEPTFVVIDPVAEMNRSIGYSETGVRTCVAALRREAQEGGFGILLIAHNTKGARAKDADVYDPGHIAGSAAWVDSARCALSFQYPKEDPLCSGERQKVNLICLKANYGASRWTETLRSEKGGAWTQAESSTAQAGRKAHEAFSNGKKKESLFPAL